MPKILVVFSSLFGANAALADDIQKVLLEEGAEVRVRGVKQIVLAEAQKPAAAEHPDATGEDLAWADGYVFTSPAHTGLLSAAMKAFIDENHDAAVAGDYLNKTFTAMSTTGFKHGGQERVVDELNAAGSAWGCVIVPPSTANPSLNKLDGNPWGLSFVLEDGRLPGQVEMAEVLAPHMRRFVAVTRSLLPLIDAGASAKVNANAANDEPTNKGVADKAPANGTAAKSEESSDSSLVAEAEEVDAPRYNITDVLGRG